MSVSFSTMGGIALFAGTQSKAPRDWAFCNGQAMNISGNSAFFAILGNRYGGDMTSFALPSLEDIGECRHIIRVQGDFAMGQELPFVEAAEGNYDENFMGVITKQDGDIPNGWIPCDGRTLGVKENQGLYGIIGHKFGSGSIDKFNIPDLNALGDQKYIICIKGGWPSFS
ncbi:MAG: phage tail protein [Chitinophagales bacterium]